MKQKLLFEILWILITAVICLLIVFPIQQILGDAYPFYKENLAYVAIALTFGRIIFFLDYHWFYPRKIVMVILIFAPIPIFFYLLEGVYEFQRFLDEEGINSIMSGLSGHQRQTWGTFIKSEMFLFWSAAFISNIVLPFRMLFGLSKLYRS